MLYTLLKVQTLLASGVCSGHFFYLKPLVINAYPELLHRTASKLFIPSNYV
nr:MAG TPA: hypothetical protein [Caudoviricetes sp.]